MKILILSDGIPPYIIGGMQRHTANLVKSLVEQNVEVTLYHCINEGEYLPNESQVCLDLFNVSSREGFQSKIISFPKAGKIPGHYIRRSKEYSKKIFEEIKGSVDQFDFVYIKGFSGWELLKHKSNFKVKMGVNFHGYEMFQRFPDLKTKLKNQMLIRPVNENLKLADFVFSYGGGIDDVLLGQDIPKEKIISIHGAVDTVWFQRNEFMDTNLPLKFLFIGRFERRKGIEELTEVLKDLINQHQFEFTFVGPVPDHMKISHSNIIYKGELKSVEDIKKVCSEHHVLVTPSYSEGMPNVIMEGMSQGLAVLASDVGATRLLISDENGWLLKEVSAKSLKSLLLDILANSSSQIDEKRKKSIEKLNKSFSWEHVGEKHLNEIRKRLN